MYPSISCLCPTYGRPRLLMNAVACFLSQKYPRNLCKLVILDDLGSINPYVPGDEGDRIRVWSQSERFPSLPEKFNALWQLAPKSDIYVIWEDDDAQLPWCLSTHSKACERAGWSYSSYVYSDYGERLHTEPTGGRFHGCLAIRGDTLQAIGGWPLTRRADFDQQLIARLRGFGSHGDPLEHCPLTSDIHSVGTDKPFKSPAYVFRWHTGSTHGQGDMRGPDDENWYDRYQPPDRSGPNTIVPAFDGGTLKIFRELGIEPVPSFVPPGIPEPMHTSPQ